MILGKFNFGRTVDTCSTAVLMIKGKWVGEVAASIRTDVAVVVT